MKKFKPKCIADMKDPKCHFYIRIYLTSELINKKEIKKESILVTKGFKAKFIKEVKANFIEWFQGDYRISFPFDEYDTSLDIWYPDKSNFTKHNEYIFVLVIKAEKGFKSHVI